jgi:hypothetical protein
MPNAVYRPLNKPMTWCGVSFKALFLCFVSGVAVFYTFQRSFRAFLAALAVSFGLRAVIMAITKSDQKYPVVLWRALPAFRHGKHFDPLKRSSRA